MCISGETSLALDLLRKMEERKIKLYVVQYSVVIDGLCKDGSLDDALNLFNEMEMKGIKANVVTYNSLIRGFCNARRWDDGAQLLRDMVTKKITPDVITFNALIDNFVKEGKLLEAKELYEEMITRGIAPNTITYNSLIDGFCMENRLDEANEMLDLMVRKRCDPNVVTFNILINGYCKAKRVDDGFKLFRQMSLRGVVADTVTYGTLVHWKYLKKCRRVRWILILVSTISSFTGCAMQVRSMMLGIYSVVKPDVKTYTIMIGGLCKEGLLAEADLLFSKMEEDDFTYNILIRANLGNGDATTSAKLIEEMKSRGFSPDVSTTKMVIDMLSSGELDKTFLDMFSVTGASSRNKP